jgi:hypothetical protein
MEKISPDVAEQELARFFDTMDLDVDPDGMDDDDRSSLKNNRRVLLRAICNGTLTINEKGEPVFTPKLGDLQPLTFHEPTGASYMAMDGTKKKDRDFSKMFGVMADMTHTNEAMFSLMKNRDLKVCNAILGFFFGG